MKSTHPDPVKAPTETREKSERTTEKEAPGFFHREESPKTDPSIVRPATAPVVPAAPVAIDPATGRPVITADGSAIAPAGGGVKHIPGTEIVVGGPSQQ